MPSPFDPLARLAPSGLSPADALRDDLDPMTRERARARLDELHLTVARAAAKAAGEIVQDRTFRPLVKAQLTPAYGSLPPRIGIKTGLGLTGVLEYQARANLHNVLLATATELLHNPFDGEDPNLDADAAKRLVNRFAKFVVGRITMRLLQDEPGLALAEVYRAHLAFLDRRPPTSVVGIARQTVLYSDLLPLCDPSALHPTTRELVAGCIEVSGPFLDRVSNLDDGSDPPAALADRWLRQLWAWARPFIPRTSTPRDRLRGWTEQHAASGLARPDDAGDPSEMAPLDRPRPPTLFDPEDDLETLQQWISGSKTPDSAMSRALSRLRKHATTATGRSVDADTDAIDRELVKRAFDRGSVEATPSRVTVVELDTGAGPRVPREVLERPLEASGSSAQVEAIDTWAREAAAELRDLVYPGRRRTVVPRTHRTRGRLDPRRLARARFADAVRRGWERSERPDPRAPVVLALLLDASGSVGQPSFELIKRLTATWQRVAEDGPLVTVLAAIYQTTYGRHRIVWVQHPEFFRSRQASVAALAALPSMGSGGQADALSIQHMVDTSRKLSRAATIYLVHFTDVGFCSSVGGPPGSGLSEVRGVLKRLGDREADGLHTTLVAVSHADPDGWDEHYDAVVTVRPTELTDVAGVARRVSRALVETVGKHGSDPT